jgi:hypothetical protein
MAYKLTDFDRGALIAVRLFQRSCLVTEDETEPREHSEGMEVAIREGGLGLAIRREMDFERSLNIPGEVNVTRDYGRFPASIAKYAAPTEPEEADR